MKNEIIIFGVQMAHGFKTDHLPNVHWEMLNANQINQSQAKPCLELSTLCSYAIIPSPYNRIYI